MKAFSKKYIKYAFYVYMALLVTLIPLYAPEGYMKLVTSKYTVFFWITILFLIAQVLFYLISVRHEKHEKPSNSDWWMLGFFVLTIVTFLGSGWKDMALLGYPGWFMGFVTFLLFVGIYFFTSRCYDRKPDMMPLILGIPLICFFWGLLNRYSVYPVEMMGADPERLGPLGNINWFAGYWSVFFPVGAVLYFVAKKGWKRILLAVFFGVALAFGVANTSDSVYLCLVLILSFLWVFAFRSLGYLRRLFELIAIGAGACQFLRLIDLMAPEAMTLRNETYAFMTSNVTLILLIAALLIRFLLLRKGEDEAELSKKVRWLRFLLPALFIAVIVLAIILIAMNTAHPGSIGALSDNKYFTFNLGWGTSRALNWYSGWITFKGMPFWRMLIGAGQDCFANFAYSVPELAEALHEQWGDAVLTNAHMEPLTFLVDIGILGTVAFYGVSFVTAVRCIKASKENPYLFLFAVGIFSYLIHGLVSFSQILNTPFLFLLLGLAEAELRGNHKEETIKKPESFKKERRKGKRW